MTIPPRAFIPVALATCLALAAGCDGSGSTDTNPPPAVGSAGRPQGGGPSMGGPESGIKPIMVKLAKGPNSLTPAIGRALNEADPAWPTIQPQAKEYAQLAAEMAKLKPSKGTAESWAALGSAYAAKAVELEKAATAKDKPAALAAHKALTESCNACHKEHRGGPGGGGPPRG